MKKKQLMVFAIASALTLGTAFCTIGANTLLGNNLSNGGINANANNLCELEWNSKNKPVTAGAYFTSRCRSVELKYGANTGVDDATDHVYLKSGVSDSYIASSGRAYDSGYGGIVNGLTAIDVNFNDEVAYLKLEAWNSNVGDIETAAIKPVIIKKSGSLLVSITSKGVRANQFKLTRVEKDALKPSEEVLHVNTLKVSCSQIVQPEVTDTIHVSTGEDLKVALELRNNVVKNVILDNDVTIDPAEVTEANKGKANGAIHCASEDLTIDLNGHRVSWNLVDVAKERTDVPVLIKFVENANVTINDSKGHGGFDATYGDQTSYGLYVYDLNAKLTINGGDHVCSMSCVQVRQGHVYINGGTFVSSVPSDYNNKYVINAIDSHWAKGLSSIECRGGTYPIDLSTNFETGPNGSKDTYVAFGYKTVHNPATDKTPESWTVVPAEEMTVKTGDELKKALELPTGVISKVTLANNVELEPVPFDGSTGSKASIYVTNTNLELDLNGFMIRWNLEKASENRRPDPNANPSVPVMIRLETNAKLTINDSSEAKTGGLDATYGENTSYGLYGYEEGSVLTINAGNITASMTAVQMRKGTLIINGGTFRMSKECAPGDEKYIINALDSRWDAGLINIAITGGTFEFDPSDNPETNPDGTKSSYLALGYEAVASEDASGNKIWTVQKTDKPVVHNGAELKAALEMTNSEATKVTLANDIALDPVPYDGASGTRASIYITNTNLELDLNGFMIRWNQEKAGENRRPNPNSNPNVPVMIRLETNAKLTINDSSEAKTGGLDATYGDNTSYGLYGYEEGSVLTINNGNITASMTAVQMRKGSLIINGGTFKMSQKCEPGQEKYIINALDSRWDAGLIDISITGGTYQFDPSDNPETNEDGTKSSYLALGYEAVKNASVEGQPDTWTVVKTDKPVVHNGAELKAALEMNNSEATKVTLANDIVLDPVPFDGSTGSKASIYVTNTNLELDLNGFMIRWNLEKASENRRPDPNQNPSVPVMIRLEANAKLTINDSSEAKTGGLDATYGENTSYGLYGYEEGSVLTINAGNITASMTAVQMRKGTLIINGGTFRMSKECAPGDEKYIINALDSRWDAGLITIAITGGTFEFDPSDNPETNPDGTKSSYLAEGYEAIKNPSVEGKHDTWTIAKINK